MILSEKIFQDNSAQMIERFNTISKLFYKDVSWGTEVEYDCDDGYKIRCKVINAEQDKNGKWLLVLLPYNHPFTIAVHPTSYVKYL